MESNTPTNLDLAFFLLSGEGKWDSGPDELQRTFKQTFEKLGRHLTRRLGTGGYHALLKRAVTLATVDFPWLAALSVTDNGVLEGFETVPDLLTVSETAAGYLAILASFIGLLETFVGRDLSLRVLHNVWPEAVQTYTDGLQGDSNE